MSKTITFLAGQGHVLATQLSFDCPPGDLPAILGRIIDTWAEAFITMNWPGVGGGNAEVTVWLGGDRTSDLGQWAIDTLRDSADGCPVWVYDADRLVRAHSILMTGPRQGRLVEEDVDVIERDVDVIERDVDAARTDAIVDSGWEFGSVVDCEVSLSGKDYEVLVLWADGRCPGRGWRSSVRFHAGERVKTPWSGAGTTRTWPDQFVYPVNDGDES